MKIRYQNTLSTAFIVAAMISTSAAGSDVGTPFDFPLNDLLMNEFVIEQSPIEIKCNEDSIFYPACLEQPNLLAKHPGPHLNFSRVSKVTLVDSVVLEKHDHSYSVTAKGQSPSGGWTRIHLAPVRYDHAPLDGIQEFIFSGSKPNGMYTMAFQNVEATTTVQNNAWLKGVRITSGLNSIEVSTENAIEKAFYRITSSPHFSQPKIGS